MSQGTSDTIEPGAADQGLRAPAATRYPLIVIGSAACLALLLVATTLGPSEAGSDRFLDPLNATARLAAVFFLLAFAAMPLARIWPEARVLVHNRRYLGLAFALVHAVHAVLIVLWARAPDVGIDALTLVGGGLAYLFALLMAVTSNDASRRALGGAWRRLHLVGGWYIWAIFALTFVERLGRDAVSSLFFVALMIVFMLRVGAARGSAARA